MDASKKRKLETTNARNTGNSKAQEAKCEDVDDAKELTRLLEPFSREQVVAILVSAALQHESLFNEIKTMASVDIVHRKIFIRGLPWDLTSNGLREYFNKFGPVDEAIVIVDKSTGKSKGFGFLVFPDMETADIVLKAQPHEIEGRKCPCKLAATPHTEEPTPQPSNRIKNSANTSSAANILQPQQDVGPPGDEADRKLFVRGLHWDTHAESLNAEFKKYGDIEDVTVTKDRQTGKSKGYGFIVFRHQMGARRALAQPTKVIDGRSTHCNLAIQPQRNNHAPVPPASAPYHMPQPPMPGPYQPQAAMYMVPPGYVMSPYPDASAYMAAPYPPAPIYAYSQPQPPLPQPSQPPPPPPRQ
ncbi:hypothetical protein THRCLA_03863 [Thraustotheca clavata]|uniref:RRM domain-containing protein n=1 Tax=Thraustotheca clavata TaxID=74557 RepID=A0A1W0A0X4_9STRA|nr:hypothetical protein THRCLA_03863 [Thraustotheca clavata]